jgi:hypothetical protein
MLRLDELRERDRLRSQENHKTYKMLYEKCANHIRRRHALGHTKTIWTVDSIVIGRPVFTYEHALRYIVEKLRKGGFDAYIDRDTYAIVISWEPKRVKASRHSSSSSKKNDARKEKVSNDIVNAWLHDAPLDTKKNKKQKQNQNEPLEMRLKRLHARIAVE